jgi:hypothetical protein
VRKRGPKLKGPALTHGAERSQKSRARAAKKRQQLTCLLRHAPLQWWVRQNEKLHAESRAPFANYVRGFDIAGRVRRWLSEAR